MLDDAAADSDAVALGERDGRGDALSLCCPVALTEPQVECDELPVTLLLLLRAGDADGLLLADGDGERAALNVDDPLGVASTLALARDADALTLPVSEPERVVEPDPRGE